MRYSFPICVAAGALAAVIAAAPALGQRIEPLDLYDLPPADVVVLGEVHDNPVQHANQALAVEAIGATALVFEMLTDRQALRITPELLQSETALEQALGWNESGWPDFAMYYPIFTAAPSPVIFGGAVEREVARRAVTEGAAAVFGAGAPLFGLNEALDDSEQSDREAGQMAAHCDALPEQMLAGMVEAQRLRDAALARAVIAAYAETAGPVALITGNGHARADWGVPRALLRAAPDLRVLSIGQLEHAEDAAMPYDLWLFTEPARRDDPCEGFADR